MMVEFAVRTHPLWPKTEQSIRREFTFSQTDFVHAGKVTETLFQHMSHGSNGERLTFCPKFASINVAFSTFITWFTYAHSKRIFTSPICLCICDKRHRQKITFWATNDGRNVTVNARKNSSVFGNETVLSIFRDHCCRLDFIASIIGLSRVEYNTHRNFYLTSRKFKCKSRINFADRRICAICEAAFDSIRSKCVENVWCSLEMPAASRQPPRRLNKMARVSMA